MFRLSSLRNYRANESRAEFTPTMPNAADNAHSERVAEARVSRYPMDNDYISVDKHHDYLH